MAEWKTISQGAQRFIEARSVDISSAGDLLFKVDGGVIICAIAAGSWLSCELVTGYGVTPQKNTAIDGSGCFTKQG